MINYLKKFVKGFTEGTESTFLFTEHIQVVGVGILAIFSTVLLPVTLIIDLILLIDKKLPTSTRRVKKQIREWDEYTIDCFDPLYLYNINKQRVLQLHGETLSEFIFKFFKVYNNSHITCYKGTEEEVIKFKPATSWPGAMRPKTATQCIEGRRRSVQDLYLICRYYYPKCTLMQILTILEKLVFGATSFNTNNLSMSYCTDIYKLVFTYSSTTIRKNARVEFLDDEFNARHLMQVARNPELKYFKK